MFMLGNTYTGSRGRKHNARPALRHERFPLSKVRCPTRDTVSTDAFIPDKTDLADDPDPCRGHSPGLLPLQVLRRRPGGNPGRTAGHAAADRLDPQAARPRLARVGPAVDLREAGLHVRLG